MPAKFWLCKKLQKRIYWIESKITTKLLEVLQDYLFAIWTVWITQLLYKQIYKRYIVCMYVLHTQAKKWNTSNAYFWQIVSMPLTQYLATNVLFTRTNSAQPYNWKRSIQIRLKRNVNKLARINFFLAKLPFFPITIQSLKPLFELQLLLLLVLQLQIKNKKKFWTFLHLTHSIKIILTFQSLKPLSELVLLLLLGLQLLIQASKSLRQLLRRTP